MSRLRVLHGNLPIGTLRRDGRNIIFEADEAWLASGPELSPIHPLRKRGRQQCNLNEMRYLHGLFYNSLPDAWGTRVMEDAFSARGLPAPDALDRLAYVGRYGMGSLIFEPTPAEFDQEAGGVFDIMETARNARHLEAHGGDVGKMREVFGRNATAGGARPKVNLRRLSAGTYATEVSADITGETGDAFILKFEGIEHIERVEHALMRLASAAGLNVAETEQVVTEVDGLERRHILVRRFDRAGDERIHCPTLYALTHGIYRSAEHADYLDLTDATTLLGATDAIPEIALRGIFNRVVGNTDDHHKNHAFRLVGNRWELAPAYDITNDLKGRFHAMRFIGRSESDTIDLGGIAAFAETCGAPRDALDVGLQRIADAIEQWPDIATASGVEQDRIRTIGEHMKKRLGVILSGEWPKAPKQTAGTRVRTKGVRA